MKVGLIARAEDRGLGLQTWEAYRHLRPERTLVVDVENPEGFPMHLGRYPDAEVVRLNAGRWLPESVVRDWLDGLDVVLSCETLYDWRLVDWARDQRVATVVQVNPEMYHHRTSGDPHPTVWWNPTTWRLSHLPDGARHVPVPVATDRWNGKGQRAADHLRVLHVVGRPAYGDRNGTNLVAAAHPRLDPGVELVLSRQRPGAGDVAGVRTVGEVANYWDLYADSDVLLLPRRYGGLCLVAQEAAAAGLAVAMPDCPPNGEWPIVPLAWRYRGTINVPCGTIPMCETDARRMAHTVNELARDDGLLAAYQAASLAWAAEHSWEALLPMYQEELALAAGLVESGRGR